MGVHQSAIPYYLRGKRAVSIAAFEKLLSFLGGDISRAFPEYEPDASQGELMWVEGQIAAGRLVSSPTDDRFQVPVNTDQFRLSKYYAPGVTSGRVWLLEIIGDSMSPDYKPGEIIACRRPDGDAIPDSGTPCIFRQGRAETFKILRKTPDQRFIGEPLNPEHDFIIFDRETEIVAVVIAKLGLNLPRHYETFPVIKSKTEAQRRIQKLQDQKRGK